LTCNPRPVHRRRLSGLTSASRHWPIFLSRLLKLAYGSLMTLALQACSGLPASPARSLMQAVPPQDSSRLVQIARQSSPAQDLSGFRLLPLGSYALDARLQLIDRAQHSLDLQYYVLDNDDTGRLLLSHLANAAQRGVRVRLLVDDLYTTHTDALLRAMHALPGVQVSLFNPFMFGRSSGLVGRFAANLLAAPRLNHRMHNKLLIADGAIAVAGGRNIADDYFQRGTQQNFVDLDALMVGPVVGALSASFDLYWNSPVVLPIDQVGASTTDAVRASIQGLDELIKVGPDTQMSLPEVDPLGYGPVGDDLEAGKLGLIWGRALALADPPDKLARGAHEAWLDSLAYQALMRIWTAKDEVTITSPYLIPGPLGIAAFESLGHKQVKMTVLTNSLAATDEPAVHTGYARYRPQLIDAGVQLYELSPSRTQKNNRLGLFGASLGRLHAKLAVVDGDKTYFGSMNLDPRSRTQNTELGIFVESAELAREMQRVIKISRTQNAYQVRHTASRHLQWVAVDGGRETVVDEEPESTFWQRVQNLLLGGVVPEQLL